MITSFEDSVLRLSVCRPENGVSAVVIGERLQYDVDSRRLSSAGTAQSQSVIFGSAGLSNVDPVGQDWEIWACQVALDKASGLLKPYILFGQGRLRFGCVSDVYLGVLNKKDIVIAKSLKIPHTQLDEKHCDDDDGITVHILNGPIVCIIKGSILCMSPPSVNQGSLPVTMFYTNLGQELINIQSPCSCKCLWNQAIGTDLLNLSLFQCSIQHDDAMMETNDYVESSHRIVATCLSFENLDQANLSKIKCVSLDATNFIPDVYSPVVTCVYVIECKSNGFQSVVQEKISRVDGSTQNKSITSYSNQLYCSTSHNQLMEWRDGHLLNCVNLQFGDGKGIQVCDAASGDSFIVVLSASGEICVVSAVSFEVCHHFSGIQHAFVGDFMGMCCDQTMFVKNTEAGLPPDQWKDIIVTDFSTCFFNMPDKLESDFVVGEASDSIQSAVTALEGRLQIGLNHMQEEERLLALKSSLIEQTCTAIHDMVLDQRTNPSSACKAGLVPLVSGHKARTPVRDVCSMEPQLPIAGPKQLVFCGDIWWRVVERSIVIGAVVRNTSNRLMKDVQLLASTEYMYKTDAWEPIESKSVSVEVHFGDIAKSTHNFPHVPLLEPCFKKARMEAEKCTSNPGVKISHLQSAQAATVSMVTNVPAFNRADECTFNMLLSWIWEQPGDQVGGVASKQHSRDLSDVKGQCRNTGREQQVVEQVGRVSVKAADFLAGTHQLVINSNETSALWQSFVALEASQQTGHLVVKSTFSSLAHKFEQMLSDRLKFEYCDSFKCWICPASLHPLYMVRIEMEPIEPNVIQLTTHHRDRNQLLLLVHALYSVLPDDVVIISRGLDNTLPILETALQAIQKETMHASRSIRNMIELNKDNSTAVERVALTEEDSAEGVDVKKVREEFLARRKHLLTGLQETHISGQDYAKLVDDITQLSLHTDQQIQILEKIYLKQER